MPRGKKRKGCDQVQDGPEGVKTTMTKTMKLTVLNADPVEMAEQGPVTRSLMNQSIQYIDTPTTLLPDSLSPSIPPKAHCKLMEKPSTSKASFTHVKPHKDPLRKATFLLKEFLMICFKKKRLISQIEMLRVIGKKYECHFHEIFKRASLGIEIIFGIDVKEMDSPKNCYALVNKMNLPNNGRVNPGKGFPKTGLLMTILGVIFLKGNCASAEVIWEFLNKMKIYAGQKHFLFGEPKKLITEDLVKLNYLEYLQIADSEPPRYKFLWGPRSQAETSKMRILEFLAKINNTVPSAFMSCYEEALKEQNENALLVPRPSTSTMAENDPE